MKRGKELFIIGDPDQSIYGFRGSDSRCFDRFLEEFPQADVIRLEENYRSSPEILAGAMALISHNPGGKRSLSPTLAPGLPYASSRRKAAWRRASSSPRKSDAWWAAWICWKPTARTATGRSEAFPTLPSSTAQIGRRGSWNNVCSGRISPYEVIGREDYLNTPGRAPHSAALQGTSGDGRCSGRGSRCGSLLKKGKALEAFGGIRVPEPVLFNDENVNQLICMSYFHKTMEDMLEALTFGEEGDIARRNSPSAAPGGCVRLMTFHGSKGLEFPAVFLFGLKQGILPPAVRGRLL